MPEIDPDTGRLRIESRPPGRAAAVLLHGGSRGAIERGYGVVVERKNNLGPSLRGGPTEPGRWRTGTRLCAR